MFFTNSGVVKNQETIHEAVIATHSYTARLAISSAVKEDAYRLRYRSYRACGFIKYNPTGIFSDKYDNLDNAETVVIYDHGVPLASVRVFTLRRGTGYTSPAMDTFPDEISALLNADSRDTFSGPAVEMTRLVRSPEANNNQGLVFLLYRMAGYIALCNHAQMFFACVRPNHAPFYKRLGYAAITEVKPYPGLNCGMLLMAGNRQRYDQLRVDAPIVDPLAGTTYNLEGFYAGNAVPIDLV